MAGPRDQAARIVRSEADAETGSWDEIETNDRDHEIACVGSTVREDQSHHRDSHFLFFHDIPFLK